MHLEFGYKYGFLLKENMLLVSPGHGVRPGGSRLPNPNPSGSSKDGGAYNAGYGGVALLLAAAFLQRRKA